MRGVIVDLDRSFAPTRRRPVDRLLIAALTLCCIAFGLVVSIVRPAAAPATAATTSATVDVFAPTGPLVRGVVLHPLQLPQRYANVDLAAMPDRLANEAAPATLRSVITVRGVPGVGSVEGPAMIMWTESGIAYWLVSPTRTTDDLIKIADELR